MTSSERVISEALALPAADRLEVVEQIWESLESDPSALELTEAQRREIDRRIEEMDADPSGGIPRSQVEAERRGRRTVG